METIIIGKQPSLRTEQERFYDAISCEMRRLTDRTRLLKRRIARGLPFSEDDAELIRMLPGQFAGLSTLTGQMSTGFQWNAQNNLTGAVYQPITNNGNIQKQYSLGTANANNAAGGADEVFSFQQGISAGAAVTVNLRAMTNLLNQTSVAIARFKGYQIRLLSATDDATISPAPNSTSTCYVTNNGNIAVPNALDFQSGSGLTITVVVFANNAINTVTLSTNGNGYPAGPMSALFGINQAGSSGGVVQGSINAAGNVTAVTLLQAGAAYTNATLNTTMIGGYPLTTGDAHVHLDLTAAGVPVNTSSANFQIINNDAAHAITAEIDVFGGTT